MPATVDALSIQKLWTAEKKRLLGPARCRRYNRADTQVAPPARQAQIRYRRQSSSGLAHASRTRANLDHVILCVDQSGSMASSVVYASIFAAVMASLPGLSTKLICFDTSIVDLTEQLADPVEVRTLSGHVQDSAKAKIEGATVELLDAQTDIVISSATTDSKGNFHFKDFGKNTYKLKIKKPGFNILRVTLHIRKHSPALAVLTLPIAV